MIAKSPIHDGLAALHFDTSRFQISADKIQVRLGLRLVSAGQEWGQPAGPIGLPPKLTTFGTRDHVRGGQSWRCRSRGRG